MKQLKIIIILLMLSLILPMTSVSASTGLAKALKGRILIQAENLGQAWYVNPQTNTRYYLGRPADALAIMQKLAIGMSNANMNRIAQIGFNDVDKAFAQKYAGRILLQVEGTGQAWYVNPVNLKKYYLGSPADAFSIMKQLGLGITDDKLMEIPLSNSMATNENHRTFNVAINRAQLAPTSLEIVRGDTVTWTNRDTIDHIIVSSNSSLIGFGSGTLTAGESYSYTFSNSGIYYYNDELMARLIGLIVVR